MNNSKNIVVTSIKQRTPEEHLPKLREQIQPGDMVVMREFVAATFAINVDTLEPNVRDRFESARDKFLQDSCWGCILMECFGSEMTFADRCDIHAPGQA